MERLYKWALIDTRVTYKDEGDYIDSELRLNRYGIRTRVQINEAGALELWVPLKDAEVARAVIAGEVKEIIDVQKELYHVFDEQLTYKNKNLYKVKYGIKARFLAARRYSWIGFMILILLLLFKFIKF
ncbi:hypothetical protein [Fusibacter sp. 3D3]|uniref:hypothetical protein n=1 Tax=Fusibacter sp. 3D3 TaxID=1048380 RepID=UPI0008538D2F|nr:hypothetical protein [Fusibacter sp. 3D3]GAU78799.1 hypothetical protein F3D3_3434 [Fusibacter sp. 3D3]